MTKDTFKLCGCLVLGLVTLVSAHAQQPVLRGAQVTESALIDALAIDGPAAPQGAGATRGFAPSSRALPPRPASKAPGKASLLITFAVDSSTLR